jgi:hypothetical protein
VRLDLETKVGVAAIARSQINLSRTIQQHSCPV